MTYRLGLPTSVHVHDCSVINHLSAQPPIMAPTWTEAQLFSRSNSKGDDMNYLTEFCVAANWCGAARVGNWGFAPSVYGYDHRP